MINECNITFIVYIFESRDTLSQYLFINLFFFFLMASFGLTFWKTKKLFQ